MREGCKSFGKEDDKTKTHDRAGKSEERRAPESVREVHVHGKDDTRADHGRGERVSAAENPRKNPCEHHRERDAKSDEGESAANKTDRNGRKREERKEPKKPRRANYI